eukprot:scaffold68955_cov54-Attheya_sp.AAC.1
MYCLYDCPTAKQTCARPARTPTTRRYRLVRTNKRAAISCPIIDALHAHYQKQTEKDTKYPRKTTTTTTTTSSPTRYNDLQARLAKSEDTNKTYATLQESTIKKPQSINDPDDQCQKQDENDI